MNRTLKRLLGFVKPYTKEFIGGIVCILLMNLFSLSVPWIVKEILGQVLADKNAFMLNLLVLITIGAMFAKGVFYYGQYYLLQFVVQRITVDLRNRMYTSLQRLSLSFYEKTHVGDIISRMTNDTAAVETTLLIGLTDTIANVTLLAGILVMMFYIHWKLAIVTLVIIPVLGIAMGKFGNKLRIVTRNIQKKAADITSILQETLSAIRVVKAFTMENHEFERFANENKPFDISMKGAQVQATLPPVVELVGLSPLHIMLLAVMGHCRTPYIFRFYRFHTICHNGVSSSEGVEVTSNTLQRAVASAERVLK